MIPMTEMNKEYAVALFALARESGAAENYMEALSAVEKLLSENPEYVDFLASPNVPKSERIKTLDTAFSDSLPEYVLSFLKLLCEKGHIRIFKGCIQEYKRLFDEYKNTSVARVISAVELSEEQKTKLKQKLERLSEKNVTLDCSVDSSLYGGITVEMDGCVYDGSLKRKLSDIKGGLLDEH